MGRVLCRKCRQNWHDSKYKTCFDCSGLVPAHMIVPGCERHRREPQPAVCLDCLDAKRLYFKRHKQKYRREV